MTLQEIADELGIGVTDLLNFDQTLGDRADVRKAVHTADGATLAALVVPDSEAQDIIDIYRAQGDFS